MLRIKIIFIFIFVTYVIFALNIDMGGIRNAAMGNVGIASSFDNSAAIYNPSILYKVTNIQLLTDYRKMFWNLTNDDISSGFVSISFPFQKLGTIALSSTFLNSMDYNRNNFGLHWGKILFRNSFSIGMSIYDYQTIFGKNEYTINDPLFIENSFNKNTFNTDFGVFLKLNEIYDMGLIVKNIFLVNEAIQKGNFDYQQRKIGLGIAYNNAKFVLSSDFIYGFKNETNNESYFLGVGAEYNLNKYFDIRSGINNTSLNFGFGINIFHKLKTETIQDLLTSEELIKTNMLSIAIDYAVQIPINTIHSGIGDHFIGIKIDYSNATSPKERYRNIVPPKIKKVYFKRTFIDSIKAQHVNTDTFLIRQKIKIDTVYIEKIKKDTIKIYSGVPDTLYRKKIAELETTKLKLENVKRINKALIHLSNAVKYYYQNKYYDALTECKRALKLAPNLALAYIRTGSIYYKIGNYNKAKF